MRLRHAFLACIVFAVAACSAGGVTPTQNSAPDRHSNVTACPVDTGCPTGGGGGGGGGYTAPIVTSRVMGAYNCTNMSSQPGCPNPTSSPAPATPGPLTWHGGPVIADYFHMPIINQPDPTHTSVYVDYWGWQSDPAGVRPYLENFIRGIGGTSWLNTVTQYGGVGIDDPQILNGAGMLAGEYSNPNAAPTYTYTPTAWSTYKLLVGEEAMRMRNYFGALSNPVGLYVIALPPSHWDFSSGTCAVHGSYTDTSGNIAYWVLLPYLPDANGACGGGLSSVSISAGHEIAEAITDPQPLSGNTAWFGATGELGDECPWWDNLGTISTPNGVFTVQALWSNANNGCVLHYP